MKKIPGKKLAFTLIELLVVMVVVGILATIGIASFKNYKAQASLARGKAFENQLEKHLLGKLISEQKKLVLSLDFEEGTGTQTSDSSGNNLSFPVNTPQWSTDTPDGSPYSIKAVHSTFAQSSFDQTQISDPNQLTVSGFVKPTFISPTRGALIMSGYNKWVLRLDGEGIPEFFLQWSNVKVKGNKKVNLSSWNHVVGTWNGSVARIYLNGELLNEESFVFSMSSSSYTVIPGDTSSYSTSEYLIDRMKVFPTAPDPDFY